MADSSSKLKQFVGSLVFAVMVATIFLYKIQEKLTPVSPLKIDPASAKKEGNLIPQSDADTKKEEKKEEKKTIEPTNSSLTWSHFSQKFQHLEKKRYQVLLDVKQKLPPEAPAHSLKATLVESPSHEIKTKEEEPASWKKIIQGWQQLNEQQQRLKTITNTSKMMPKEHNEEN